MSNLVLLARACEWISDRFFDLSRYIEDKSWGYESPRPPAPIHPPEPPYWLTAKEVRAKIESTIKQELDDVVYAIGRENLYVPPLAWQSDPLKTQEQKDADLAAAMPTLKEMAKQCKKGDPPDDVLYKWQPITATITVDKDAA
jgi:hypothetical protein